MSGTRGETGEVPQPKADHTHCSCTQWGCACCYCNEEERTETEEVKTNQSGIRGAYEYWSDAELRTRTSAAYKRQAFALARSYGNVLRERFRDTLHCACGERNIKEPEHCAGCGADICVPCWEKDGLCFPCSHNRGTVWEMHGREASK